MCIHICVYIYIYIYTCIRPRRKPLKPRSPRKDCSQEGSCFSAAQGPSGEWATGRYGHNMF